MRSRKIRVKKMQVNIEVEGFEDNEVLGTLVLAQQAISLMLYDLPKDRDRQCGAMQQIINSYVESMTRKRFIINPTNFEVPRELMDDYEPI
jgi:hypothetical protein